MKLHILPIGAAMAFALSACSDNWTGAEPAGSTATGSVDLSSMSVEVNPNAIVISRAAYDVSAFRVSIHDSEQTPKGSWAYSEMKGLVELPAGDYTMTVVSTDNPPAAAFGAPYFKGQTSFTILPQQISNLGSVTCQLANLMVSVRFTDELKALLDDGSADVKVKVNDSNALTFTPAVTEPGYFMLVDASCTMVAEFTGKVSGSVISFTQAKSNNILPGYHHIITFGVNTPSPVDPDPSGSTTVNVEISTEIDVVNQNTGVEVEEDIVDPGERPGTGGGSDPEPEPEPEPAGPISFTSPGLDLNGVNEATDFGTESEKKKAIVNIAAQHGIANLKVHIEAELPLDPVSPLDWEGGLKAVGLSTDFDLAYPKPTDADGNPLYNEEGEEIDYTAQLRDDLHFPVGDQVIGKTALVFDITEFMPLIPVMGTGVTDFVITVIDTQGNTKSLTLRIHSVQP